MTAQDQPNMRQSAQSPVARVWRQIKPLAWALLAAFLVRVFFFQPFSIPSGSMLPTLWIGDHLFVSKYTYGYSRHSFPLPVPFIEGRLFGRLPERGDVVVFKLPGDNELDFIKRVVGLPGDRIQMKDGILHLNGSPAPRAAQPDFPVRDSFGRIRPALRHRETLTPRAAYETLDMRRGGEKDNTPVFLVPGGHVFVMGDNRDNSTDSRSPDAVGFVPAVNIVGRAEVIYFSIAPGARWLRPWTWPARIRWGRIWRSVGP